MNVYSLAIEELNGKTVRLLVTDDGRALCVPGTYGLGPSCVDATGLRFTGDRLEGPIRLTVEPDAWFPPDRKPLSCRLELDASLHDGLVTGVAGPYRVSGTVAVEDPVPDPAHWVLTIEQVAPDWPPHMGRGELVVGVGEYRLRSPVAHAWVGRVEDARLNLAGGRVQAVVGMQPGGTDLGSERVVCELDMTVINRTIAGCCTVTGENGQPQRRGLRGRIVASQPAFARPVVAAGPATLAIDVRSLRAPRSVRPWRSLDFSDVRHGRFAGLADLDGDGMAEILSASASQPLGIAGLLAMRLDGTRLWQWGEIGVGRPPGDAAVQTADLDGDGQSELLLFDARGILRIYRSPDVSPLPGRRRIGTWNYTDYECPAVPPPGRRNNSLRMKGWDPDCHVAAGRGSHRECHGRGTGGQGEGRQPHRAAARRNR